MTEAMTSELAHDWTEKPKRRLSGTLSIRTRKADEPANDRDEERQP